jgi:Patatin-like phospholipase
MKEYLKGFYNSFPVQLVLLHLRKYQVLLLFWFVLGSAINGDFMSTFGADSLFLAPEYLGNVNAVSAAFVGIATAIFFMSWHITTFILHSKQFKFLATTTKPFLKYFLNNSIIPILFLVFYCIKAIQFDRSRELMTIGEILVLIAGFVLGFLLTTITSLVYFFGAEKTMMRKMEPLLLNPTRYLSQFGQGGSHYHEKGMLKIEWFFNTRFKLKKPRNISHYSQEFIDTIFKRHHFSAVISIILAFLFLAMLGLFQENDVFKLPAAAGILILFSILIAASGALAYWLKSWSFPVMILVVIFFDLLLRMDLIDPRNKAYGLNYTNVEARPVYGRDSILQLCTIEKMTADKGKMVEVLNRWKNKQTEAKPLMYLLNFSGGGTRSATFTFNILQQLDTLLDGRLMDKTFLISGASGGMLGATYFREIYCQKQMGKPISLQDKKYVDNISRDLLNPLFSSLVTRDIFAPAQKFSVGPYKYVMDRAYSFEEQLNDNTSGLLDKQLRDYAMDEHEARIPLMIYNSTISSDGRKMMISTQPISFMMRNWPDTSSGIMGEPDAVDFGAFFHRQDPYNLRLLSALRINATFPYILPNVWLPTEPVIDVMDAGIRDNYGQETMLRFLHVFRDWLKENVSGVVFIQIRDRKNGDWQDHFSNNGLGGLFTKPVLVVQYNWMKMQDYYHEEMISLANASFEFPFEKVSFSYIPAKNTKAAALNFHLTAKEKLDIRMALKSESNTASFKRIIDINKSIQEDSSGSRENQLPIITQHTKPK